MSCLQIYMNTGVHMFISMVERSQCSFHSTISMGVMKRPLNTPCGVIEHPLGSLTFTLAIAPKRAL